MVNLEQLRVKVFRVLNCEGMARIDFLYDKTTGNWFANEINTIPGTLYHHLWKASGVELQELLKLLIDYAEENYKEKRSVNFSFESSEDKYQDKTIHQKFVKQFS